MNGYVLLNIILIAMYYLSLSLNAFQVELVNRRHKYRVKPLYAFLFIVPLFLFAANRSIHFGDTYAYQQTFNQIPLQFNEFYQYLGGNPKDPAFTVLCWIIKFIGFDFRGLLYIIAFVQSVVLYYVYRKYSPNYFLSILFFLLSTDYYSWMFNGIRQFLAVTIIFAATPFLLEKKYPQMVLIILFASLFHQSALMMLPVIFFVNGEPFNKKILLFSIAVILSIVFLLQFTEILDGFLQGTQYENIVSDYQVGDFSEDNGANPLRALFYAIPTILAFIGLKFIKKRDDSVINLAVNMSVLSTGFYLLAVFTSGIFIGRLPIYFSLWNYILLPWEINNIFKKDQKILITIITLIAFFVFYYVQMHMVWNVY